MSESNKPSLRGFQVKHRPMAEAVAIADAIVRRYGKQAQAASAAHDSSTPDSGERPSDAQHVPSND